MRAPFRHSPSWPAWFWFEDFGPIPESVVHDLSVDVADDDPAAELVDRDGAPLRRRMTFGFCRPESPS